MTNAVESVSFTAAATVEALGSVRRLVVAAVDALDVGIDEDLVAVLTSEVFTNAVQADSRDVFVQVTRFAGPTVRVAVVDHGCGWPAMANPAPLDEAGGRGLLIVDTLAHAWGAVTDGESGTTTVWFEVAPDAPA